MKSPYEMRLDAVLERYQLLRATGGGNALRKILLDLEGRGPIGALLFDLDDTGFQLVINLLLEFKKSGRSTPFNSLHENARAMVADASNR